MNRSKVPLFNTYVPLELLGKLLRILLIPTLTLVAFTTQANDKTFNITLKDHLFYPTEVIIPAGVKVKLIIENRDSVAEEFDSFDLNREKMLFPQRKSTIYIGPLSPGEYHFFGEYHPNSALGKVIVKASIEADVHAN